MLCQDIYAADSPAFLSYSLKGDSEGRHLRTALSITFIFAFMSAC